MALVARLGAPSVEGGLHFSAAEKDYIVVRESMDQVAEPVNRAREGR